MKLARVRVVFFSRKISISATAKITLRLYETRARASFWVRFI